MLQINDAYKACGFGWFHVKLIFISFLGTVSGVLVTHTTSFLLPVAECDLKMGLIEKGLLNAAPFLGKSVFLYARFSRRTFLVTLSHWIGIAVQRGNAASLLGIGTLIWIFSKFLIKVVNIYFK